MSNWISCSESLPGDGNFVLVLVKTIRGEDEYGSRHRVMRIIKGLTASQRKLKEIQQGYECSYGNADEHENNKKPYKWIDAGNCSSFGQEVTHWMPLPSPPESEQ